MQDNNGKLQVFHECLQGEHSIATIKQFLTRLKHEVLLADAMLDMAEMRLEDLEAITVENIVREYK